MNKVIWDYDDLHGIAILNKRISADCNYKHVVEIHIDYLKDILKEINIHTGMCDEYIFGQTKIHEHPANLGLIKNGQMQILAVLNATSVNACSDDQAINSTTFP